MVAVSKAIVNEWAVMVEEFHTAATKHTVK